VSAGSSRDSPSATPENSSSEEEEESDGQRPPREVESPTPITMGRRSGRGVDARRRAVSGGGRVRYRGTGKRYGNNDGRHGGASRTLEEEEAGLLSLR
jgi:hypothetical protein